MNYVTSIVILPVFLAIWLFDLRELHRRPAFMTELKPAIRTIVVFSMIGSTLQVISCVFWLFGFYFSIKNRGLLSTANARGEVGDCFGLVGAEIFMSLLNLITSITTFLQMISVRSIAKATTTMTVSFGRSKNEIISLGAFCTIMTLYTVLFAWPSAWNRRCPKATPIWKPITHQFFATYLAVDCAICLCSMWYSRCITADLLSHNRVANANTNSHAASNGTNGTGENNTTLSLVTVALNLAQFLMFQCVVTLIAMIPAMFLFIVQFYAKWDFLNNTICGFCPFMFLVYSLRRSPMIMLYIRENKDWKPRFMAYFLTSHTTSDKAKQLQTRVTGPRAGL